MSIAVISDLHLGARAGTDLFQHDDAEFVRFLTMLERNFSRIVLLGDIWETLTSTFPLGHRGELRLARERHREIAERFRRPEYTYVHGNHDLVAGEEPDCLSELRLNVGSARILFAHGHQSDRLVMKARPVSETGVWLGGWLRRARLHKAYRFFDQLDVRRSEHTHEDRPSQVENWAFEVAQNSSTDIVVTGHTHCAKIAERGSSVFLNSGSCSEGKLSFLSIDAERGDFQIHTSF